MSQCKTCGAEIVWVTTTAGKRMPLDITYKTVVTNDGKVVLGRESHFSTCPDADIHRKRKELI